MREYCRLYKLSPYCRASRLHMTHMIWGLRQLLTIQAFNVRRGATDLPSFRRRLLTEQLDRAVVYSVYTVKYQVAYVRVHCQVISGPCQRVLRSKQRYKSATPSLGEMRSHQAKQLTILVDTTPEIPVHTTNQGARAFQCSTAKRQAWLLTRTEPACMHNTTWLLARSGERSSERQHRLECVPSQ